MFGKKKVAMLGAELIGTAVLTLSVISVRSSGIGYSFFVALGAGLAMAVLTFALSANSGAQLNPALTIGLWTARKVKTLPTVLYVVVQLLGAWAAYGLYIYLVKTHLQNSSSGFSARVMLAEAVGTFIFVFGWAAAVAQKFEGIQLAATVGGAFALGIMVASLASSGIINPAVAFGTHAWNIFGSGGWGTYALGPVVGGVVGVNLYNMVFANGKATFKVVAKKK